MADNNLTPYSTAKPLFGAQPSWIVDEIEKQRISAYAVYESIYWNYPNTFKLVQRGSSSDPIYIPAGRQIVETFNRFLAPGLTVSADPAYGTPNDQLLANQVFTDFAKREKFYSKFNTGKRYGLIRGDQAWHLWADPEREPGARVSIYQIDPGSLFPIYDVNNIDNIIGWHIVELVVDDAGKSFISRATYLKQTGKGGPSPITYDKALYEVDDWGGPGMDQDPKPVQVVSPMITLPAPIDALPIYVIPNFDEPGQIWGASEMRGMERIIAAIDQGISDEELTLAMEGLGVYATDAGTPVDEDGNDVDWNLGPGRVVELPDGKKFVRVTGAGSVTPFQDHLKYLHQQIDQTFGHSDVAKGNVDVSVDVSGISLLLQLGPLLARAGEREQIITDVTSQMLFGFSKWWVAYEGGAFNSLVDVTRWMIKYGEKVPRNRKEEVTELITLHSATPTLLPPSYIRMRLRQLGYDDMPDEAAIEAELTKVATAAAAINQDAQAARLNQDVSGFLGAPAGG
jgi:hypothetical protein